MIWEWIFDVLLVINGAQQGSSATDHGVWNILVIVFALLLSMAVVFAILFGGAHNEEEREVD